MRNPKTKGKMANDTAPNDTAAALSVLSSAGKNQGDEALNLAPAGRKVGRPRREVPTAQRTVSFTDDSLTALKKLSARSGREGFDNPDFSKTVRVAIRLSSFAPDEEIKKAFDEELEG
jgi:hypothetical protein